MLKGAGGTTLAPWAASIAYVRRGSECHARTKGAKKEVEEGGEEEEDSREDDEREG